MNSSEARSSRAFQAVEELLAHIHPREDARAAADELRERFVSADAMFLAGMPALEQLGLRCADALLVSRMTELARCLRLESFGRHPCVGDLRSAAAYLTASFHGLQVERFYMLCLDARGRLRERVLLQEGTSDGALFSLKAMLREVVRVDPCAVIISHNHPAHTLRPSQDDINCTLEALRALTVVGVPLLDHIVIAGDRAVSLRDNGFVPAALWLMQHPNHRLLRRWLEAEES